MIRTTKDNKDIEINTYNDLNHLRNICKMIGIIWWNLLTIEECRNEINWYLEYEEYLEDEIVMSWYDIY